MKQLKFFKYIKVQIAFYYLMVSICTISLFGVILYYSISATLLNETLISTSGAVDYSGKYVEVYIERLKAVAKIIVEHPDTIGYLQGDSNAKRDNISALIHSAIDSDEYLQSITVVSKVGQIISNEEALDMTISSDMMEEPWYRAAIESDMPVLTSARMQDFSMDTDQWVISISQEILGDEGENIGVLLIDIKYLVLESYFTDLNLGNEGFVFILNGYDEVVYHADTSYFEDTIKTAELIKIASMSGYEKDMGILTHHYDIENSDWTLVGVSSLDGLNIIRRQIIETLVVIGLILLVLVTISGVVIAGRITKPIKALEEAMKDIDSTLKEVNIDTNSSYEATQLTLRFNEMLKRIEVLMQAVSKNEKYLREYEIKALHSQINPHFLYNTLDTIVWMAEFGDSESVIAVTKSLAGFFRISLSRGEEMITLEQEMEHVRQYLFIQKQRYQEKLNYHLYLEEELKDVKVPKILLQPIVENAIYHGIRELEEPGWIEVVVKLYQGQILMSIKDNGKGFDTKAIHMEDISNVKLGGVGIKNVDQRIKLYYGEQFGVRIESVKNVGTTVTMNLPLS